MSYHEARAAAARPPRRALTLSYPTALSTNFRFGTRKRTRAAALQRPAWDPPIGLSASLSPLGQQRRRQ